MAIPEPKQPEWLDPESTPGPEIIPEPAPTKRASPASLRSSRPRAWEDDAIPWNFFRVPARWRNASEEEAHPIRRSAIFVVHGMGMQHWTETAVSLRSGFEDALEAIRDWQRRQDKTEQERNGTKTLPPPFVHEGFWANYSDLEATFPKDWERFSERERSLFRGLWQRRAVSAWRTARWLLQQQVGLLHPRVIREVGFLAWVLYWPLQVVAGFALLLGLLRHRKVVSEVIGDVRLYCSPRGEAEQAICQKIDHRVGAAFLQLIGLDWEFKPLTGDQRLTACGEPTCFERVVWVAHSLGTVISYNVLSDLFARADELAESGTDEQREGVEKFRVALRRFITLGSPLDKIAYLFGAEALRPWPKVARSKLLSGGEQETEERLREAFMGLLPSRWRAAIPEDPDDEREWWVNFYHVLDPVSGPLESPLVCGDQPPLNVHLRFRSGLLPGLAHIAYWRDLRCLRYILGRTFGAKYLWDKKLDPPSTGTKLALAIASYVVSAVLILGPVGGVAWGLWTQGPGLLRAGLAAVKAYLLGL